MADEATLTGLGTMVDYAAISGGIAGDEATMIEILAPLNREDALYHCASINTMVTGFDLTLPAIDRQRALVQRYFSADQGKAIDAFAKAHGGANNVAVFFRGQALELARWVSRYCSDKGAGGETFENPDIRHRFAKAALVASDLWNKRVYADRLRPIQDQDEQLRRALGAFRKGSEDSGHAEHTGTAMGRGWLLFTRHLPNRLPNFRQLFQEKTGLTIEEYFTCAVALILYTFPKRSEGPAFRTDYVAAETAVAPIFDRFIALRGQSPDQLCEAIWTRFPTNDYKGLRMRRIINFPRGLSVILDPMFFTESLTVAPLFDVITGENFRQVLGAFGNAFEDYVLEFLREMFPTRPGLVDRLTTNVKGKDAQGAEFECDAILNDAHEIFVGEIKASWLREDTILTDDPDDFVQQLLLKYGIAEQGTERKGAAQLARSIGAIMRGEWRGPNNELSDACKAYPILIVHDERLSYPGTATFLGRAFRRHLGAVPQGKIVENLIILTVADIENLSTSLENFGFTEFLKEYSTQHPDRNISVHNFLYHSRFHEKLKGPQKLRDICDTIMAALKKTLFPPKQDTQTSAG